MTIASMTGFARAEGHADGLSWVWEAKSVNSKSLDMRFRLPPGFDALELPLRASIAQRLKRGNVTAALQLARGGSGSLRLNREALAAVLAIAREVAAEIESTPPRLDGLLAIKGVIESGDESEDEATRERRDAALLASWEEALCRLAEMRGHEGRRLAGVLEARLAEISALVAAAGATAAAQPEALRAQLRAQLKELLDAVPQLPEDRLAQEAALLIAKADVREELDRLEAHVAGARALIAEGGAIGRRFDFLCQELNREANTLCSKSADLELTRLGLALKAAIEQLREQVQNIE
ncbi:MAG TPA: YicC/YloC family endoribonuclease [Stellaceae bacterium]|nr:YicC/YloC family endoribonuclease [Stellaceae bacterium]